MAAKSKENRRSSLFNAPKPPSALDNLTTEVNPATGGLRVVQKDEGSTLSESQSPKAEHPPRAVAKPMAQLAKKSPVGLAASLMGMGTVSQEQQERLDQLERQLAAGQSVVEIDPDKIENSFVSDRLEVSDEATNHLVQQIQERGQLVPILVRPHPDKSETYQIAYGHRRVRAARILKRPVRAVVRNLSNDELVVAQGLENNAREDLSFIEKALFAATLDDLKFDRHVIQSALGGIDRADCSKMIWLAKEIPQDILRAIGKAPKIGRPRWIQLRSLLKDEGGIDEARTLIADAKFAELKSDDRFALLLEKLLKQESREVFETYWRNPETDKQVASFRTTDRHATLQFDRKEDDGFARFIYEKLDELYQNYAEHKASDV